MIYDADSTDAVNCSLLMHGGQAPSVEQMEAYAALSEDQRSLLRACHGRIFEMFEATSSLPLCGMDLCQFTLRKMADGVSVTPRFLKGAGALTIPVSGLAEGFFTGASLISRGKPAIPTEAGLTFASVEDLALALNALSKGQDKKLPVPQAAVSR